MAMRYQLPNGKFGVETCAACKNPILNESEVVREYWIETITHKIDDSIELSQAIHRTDARCHDCWVKSKKSTGPTSNN